MHSSFRQLIDRNAPKMNHAMMRGLAVHKVGQLEQYINSVFRSAAKSFPEGLEYVGYERCSPLEEYTEATRARSNNRNKRTGDIARSDIYMCKYQLRWKGVDLEPKYIYLPFLRESGEMWLGGAPYHISPVLSDRVISVGFDSVFVRLLRDKLTFKRCLHTLMVDGKRETTHVVWSKIYRNNASKRKVMPTTRANTTVMHYLFARMGFKASMRALLGFDPVVSDTPFDKQQYDPDKWVICNSACSVNNVKPATYIGQFYKGTNIEIAIPKVHWNATVKSIIGSVYYLLDHFPSKLTLSSLENTQQWMILLGHIVFSGNYTDGKLYESINEHFNSLEGYVDTVIYRKLEDAGYSVNNLYDLLVLVIRNFNDWIVNAQSTINSVYGKELEVDYYVGFEITSGIFRFGFNLNKLAARKELTEKDVTEMLNRNITTGAVYKLRSGNLAVSGLNYSGDNMYPKVTAIIAEQESLPGPKRGKHKRKVPDITRYFHSSMLEIGSMLYLPKSRPICTSRMNPYTSFVHTKETIMPRMYQDILQKTQSMFDGHTPDDLPK